MQAIFRLFSLAVCFALFLSCTVNMYGQELFVRGYIITLAGDTVQGLLKNAEPIISPKNITFKPVPDAEPVIYTPHTIAAYGLKNYRFESAIVKRETSPQNISDLTYDWSFHYVSDTVFVQLLIDGVKKLYVYTDPQAYDHFYIKTPDGLELLNYKAYSLEPDLKGLKMQENTAYKEQLKSYLKDCKEIDFMLAKTKHEYYSMIDLFLNYYRCIRKPMPYRFKPPARGAEFGVTGGLAITNLKYKGSNFYNMSKTNFQPGFRFTAGFFADVGLGRKTKKVSLYNELAFWHFKAKSLYSFKYNATYYFDQEVNFNYFQFRLYSLVRYKVAATKNFKMFINAGAFNGLMVAGSNQLIVTGKYYSWNINVNQVALKDIKRYEFAPVAGLGLQVKKVTIDARFCLGGNMHLSGIYWAKSNYMSLQVGYKLF